MARKYYGFEFWDGTETTTCEPNQRTNRMSIAGELKVFDNTTARSIWVREYAMYALLKSRGYCCIYRKYPRIAICRNEIRDYHLGMSLAAFNEMLENLSGE
jgi:hypothetical protein